MYIKYTWYILPYTVNTLPQWHTYLQTKEGKKTTTLVQNSVMHIAEWFDCWTCCRHTTYGTQRTNKQNMKSQEQISDVIIMCEVKYNKHQLFLTNDSGNKEPNYSTSIWYRLVNKKNTVN